MIKWLVNLFSPKKRMRTLVALTGAEVRHDGLAGKVIVQTSKGETEIEIPVALFAQVIATVSGLAMEASRKNGALTNDARKQAGLAVEIPARSFQVVRAPDGRPCFLFHVGTLDLVFPFDSQKLGQEANTLMAALLATAATDKARRDS